VNFFLHFNAKLSDNWIKILHWRLLSWHRRRLLLLSWLRNICIFTR